jgi:serine/threonine protein kinase
MKLFDNLIAFDPTQRPSISEIRNSKWIKEINWELKDQLKNELIRREKMNINNENININKNEKKKVDDLLSKIKERKRIEVETEMKKQLFPMNYNNEIKNENNNKTDKTEKNSKNCTNNNLNGFIQINVNNKNMNSLMTLFKGFLKNEGYNITKKDLINSNMEVSNGEVDVNLTFEKMNKIVKVSFYLIKGNQDEFINFKKIMKKIHIKEE